LRGPILLTKEKERKKRKKGRNESKEKIREKKGKREIEGKVKRFSPSKNFGYSLDCI